MRVIFACTLNIDQQDWLDGLRAALPEADILPWEEGGEPVGADIAVVWKPPVSLLQREPGIRAIFNMGAGVDALFALPGLRPDIDIVRMEDAGMAVQMAEYALHALVRIARRFAEYEAQQRNGQWQPLPDLIRRDWPVGVLGMGVMGSKVASVLAALDYPVAGWSRSGQGPAGVEMFAGPTQLSDFLARTRVLINTLPLTPDTKDILRRDTLMQLIPGAYLINMGRGEHLVEEDLQPLLNAGHLLGASLDVFREEPLPAGHPFWLDTRIHVTPHIAAASLRDESITQVTEKIRRYLAGQAISGVVAHDVRY